MQPHCVQQAQAYITVPTRSIPNAHHGYAAMVLSTVLTNETFRLATYQSSVYFVAV